VINEETRRLPERDSSSKSEVLVIESRGRSKSRGSKKSTAESRSKSRGRNAKIECHYCHNMGHKKCNAANEKRTRVKRSSKHRNKTMIVTMMLTVLVQQLRGL
jgi:hypothetical protein